MAEPVKRPYRSERRREQAEQTRERVLDAAQRVFEDRGFERATITAIAEEAGVSPETVYARFGNKRTVLVELIGRAVRGQDRRPVREQRIPQAVAAARDHREQLRLFAPDIAQRLARVSPLMHVLGAAAAADPELAAVVADVHATRRRALRGFVDQLMANGRLALDADAATDTVWSLASPELYRLLTHVRGWSQRRYATWLESTLADLLVRR